jgi:hypothetical protein
LAVASSGRLDDASQKKDPAIVSNNAGRGSGDVLLSHNLSSQEWHGGFIRSQARESFVDVTLFFAA